MKIFVIAFIIGLFLSLASVSSETLDYGQCKVFYIFNETCLTQNCTQSFYPKEICAKSFPRINQNIVLDSNNPLYILPDYNFSIKISEKFFQEQVAEILELQTKVTNLEDRLEGLNTHLNTQLGLLSSEMQNFSTSIRNEIIQLQHLARQPAFAWEWVVALIVLILIGIGYIGIKSGMIRLPKYKFPDYETIEPKVEELRKKKFK